MGKKFKLGLAVVAIGDIRLNPVAIRQVDQESADFLGLVQSMKNHGFTLSTITVRPNEDAETHEQFLELVDGLHRVTAARAAGITEIPANIISLTEDKMLEAQLLANVHHIETKPREYSEQIKRIMVRNPEWTINDMAEKLGKSVQWVQARLGLLHIQNETLVKLINDGDIDLVKAYALSKLPADEQINWLTQAQTQDAQTFVANVNQRAKDIRDARRAGKDAPEIVFKAQPHSRPIKEIVSYIDEGIDGDACATLVKEVKTLAEAFVMGLKFCVKMDPVSIQAQLDKHNADIKAKEEAKARRLAEREAKKRESAAKAEAEGTTADDSDADEEGEEVL